MTPISDEPKPSQRLTSFKLTRYYSISSLIGIGIVMIALLWIMNALAIQYLTASKGRSNAQLTQVFSNTLWEGYRDFVLAPGPRTRETLLSHPDKAALLKDVRAMTRGVQIVKVKIYNLDGLTVFSTDETQTGNDKSKSEYVQKAAAGIATNTKVYREKFVGTDGVLHNSDLITSYLPIYRNGATKPEGVIEVYSDITGNLVLVKRVQWQVIGLVLSLLSILYASLYFVVRKADRIMSAQDAEREKNTKAMRHLAFHDSLTGLPNRAAFAESLNSTIAAALENNHTGALMFIDLDRFKLVNDSLGHQAGDHLLKEIAVRISKCIGKDDALFRVGGDEFTVVLPRVDQQGSSVSLPNGILTSLAQPVIFDGHELQPSASVGIALFPADGECAADIIRNADAAMYSVKNAGPGMHAFYQTSMNTMARQRLAIEADLRVALHEQQFVLHYQPRVHPGSRSVIGVEALLRWHSPSRGMVPPMDFIDILEETGLIWNVGEWVLRTACEQLVQWESSGEHNFHVSVNVSAVQFQNDDFVPRVEQILRETGANANNLELELTESLLIANPEKASHSLAQLKQLGVRTAIDDFGTGYSSLSYLTKFPVDCLKLDRSFVTEIATNERYRAVASAICSLADSLEIDLVAEGIETEEQAQFFADAGYGELQGFLFSKGLPTNELQSYLKQSKIAHELAQATDRTADALPAD